jgi:hypothetical protein
MATYRETASGAGFGVYFRILVAGLTVVLGLGATVVAVDPYSLYGSPRIEGFNRWKTRFFWRQYDAKPRLAMAMRPRHLVIGTSTAGSSLRPDHEVFRGEPAFNYALAGSTPRLQSMAFSHMAKTGDLRSLILCVDFFAYNAFMDQWAFRQFEYAVAHVRTPAERWRQARRMLESRLAGALRQGSVADAAATVMEQQRPGVGGEYRDIRADGYWRNPRPLGTPQITLFTRVESQYLGQGWFPAPARRFAFEDGHGRSTIDEFRQILRRARDEGLQVDVAIMPFHARLAEAMHGAGLWDDFEELKRRLVMVSSEPGTEWSGLRIWDFSGYSGITTEQVKNAPADARWFGDAIHPSESTGDLMLLRMRGTPESAKQVPADFGRRLKPTTIEADIAAATQRRAVYLNARLADVEDVQRLVRSTAPLRTRGG